MSVFPRLLRRTAVAVPGIALFCAVVLIDTDLLTVSFFALIAGLAAWEATGILAPGSGLVASLTALLATGSAAAVIALGTRYQIVVPLAPGVILSICWLFRSGKTDARTRLAGSLGILALISLGMGLLARHVLAGGNGYLIAVPLGICWMGDSAAYFAGSAFGKHRLLPDVSPAKTVEGLGAGIAGAIVGAVIAGVLLLDLPLVQMIVVGAAGGSAAVIGDLFESALKRDAGVKDSGSILPGHGGILDRFDSIILVAPVTWLLLTHFGHIGAV